jgi:prefoldin subunit 5
MDNYEQRQSEIALQSEYNQLFKDQITDLEARIESLEKYVSDLRRAVDNIHPVQYNIVAKDDTNV